MSIGDNGLGGDIASILGLGLGGRKLVSMILSSLTSVDICVGIGVAPEGGIVEALVVVALGIVITLVAVGIVVALVANALAVVGIVANALAVVGIVVALVVVALVVVALVLVGIVVVLVVAGFVVCLFLYSLSLSIKTAFLPPKGRPTFRRSVFKLATFSIEKSCCKRRSCCELDIELALLLTSKSSFPITSSSFPSKASSVAGK